MLASSDSTGNYGERVFIRTKRGRRVKFGKCEEVRIPCSIMSKLCAKLSNSNLA